MTQEIQDKKLIEVDLCVFGGTPAGIFSAVAAARRGLTVLIIEPTAHLGGLVTSGLNATDIGGRKIIKGMVKDFYRKCGQKYGIDIEIRPEPKLAATVFSEMIKEYPRIRILYNDVSELRKENRHVIECVMSGGARVQASYFIDGSYEGDLLRLAGVTYRAGREAKEEYGEPHAGRTALQPMMRWQAGGIPAVGANGKLLKFVHPFDGRKEGDGDGRLQAYSFRLTLTDNPDLMVPNTKPSSYNPEDYELLRRMASVALPTRKVNIINRPYGSGITYSSSYFNLAEIAGGKRDMNSGPMAPLNLPHANDGWLEASSAGRQKIYEYYKQYTLGILHFIRTDETVPIETRHFFSRYGFCRDEFTSTDHFPPALYVREGRRLVGEKVFTEHSIQNGLQDIDAAVALARYPLDCKSTQWTTTEDGSRVMREGGFFFRHNIYYALPYWIMLPKRSECVNLLVPVAASASHVGHASIRMEPHWMQLGEAAGVAVALACKRRVSVHDISAAEIRQAMEWSGSGSV